MNNSICKLMTTKFSWVGVVAIIVISPFKDSMDLSGFWNFNSLENQPPTISDIPDQVTWEDVTLGPIFFTIDDAETPLNDLIVYGESDDQAVIANGGILVEGVGGNRSVTISPLSSSTGEALITLTVDDGQDTASDTFNVLVKPVNDPPTISDIQDQVTQINTILGPIFFTIDDSETPLNDLIVYGDSSDQSVVANVGIVFGGVGGNRSVFITPVAGGIGKTTITVTVDDGQDTASDTFDVTVTGYPVYLPIVIRSE